MPREIAFLLLDHRLHEDDRREQRALQVQIKHFFVLVEFEVEDGLVGVHHRASHVAARAVHQRVHAAVFRHDLLIDGFDHGAVEHVARVAGHLRGDGRLRVRHDLVHDFLLQVQHHDFRALFEQITGGPAREHACGSGYDDDAVFEIEQTVFHGKKLLS